MDFPLQVSGQALGPEGCKTAEVEVRPPYKSALCVCEISWHIHMGAQAVRWPQIGARSRGDQDGDGEPPPGEPARGWAPRPGPIATILQSRPCPPEMEALDGRKECALR